MGLTRVGKCAISRLVDPKVSQQAIDKMFPKLDEGLRTEVHNRISEHIFKVFKDKVFENNVEELRNFDQAVKDEQDDKKQVEFYIKQILDKFASLSSDRQKKIEQELKEELDRVIKEIYKAYE